MWATLALTAALGSAPAQTAPLTLDNVRETYGILGQRRPDAKLLPGDVYVVAFDIKNLQVKDDGKVVYSMGMELIDKDKKTQFKKEPKELEAINSLGGSRIPSFALSVIGTDTAPGEYTLIVTVKDHAANKTQTLTRKFEVLKPQFGFVRVGITYDGGAVPAPTVAVPGQTYWVNFGLVGFELTKDKDPAKQHPNVSVEMRILDLETGKPTLAKSSTGNVTELSDQQYKTFLPFLPFPINLNRNGKFKIELKATDNLSKKTVVQELEFTVLEVK
jgi:hypothetical protein